MNANLVGSFQHHQVLYTLVIYYIAASAIGTMPQPTQATGFYRWAHDFLHVLAANAAAVFAKKYPDLPKPPQ